MPRHTLTNFGRKKPHYKFLGRVMGLRVWEYDGNIYNLLIHRGKIEMVNLGKVGI